MLFLSGAFTSQTVIAATVAPQVQIIIQSCDTPNNLGTAKAIEIYGVIDDITGAISNLSVLEVISFDVGDLKMIVQGGNIIGTPGADVIYKNILDGDSSLSITNNIGTLTYKGQQTIFTHCK